MEEVRRQLKRGNRKHHRVTIWMGNTIIMITHDLAVAKHAKRVVRIVDGVLYENEEDQPANSTFQAMEA